MNRVAAAYSWPLKCNGEYYLSSRLFFLWVMKTRCGSSRVAWKVCAQGAAETLVRGGCRCGYFQS